VILLHQNQFRYTLVILPALLFIGLRLLPPSPARLPRALLTVAAIGVALAGVLAFVMGGNLR